MTKQSDKNKSNTRLNAVFIRHEKRMEDKWEGYFGFVKDMFDDLPDGMYILELHKDYVGLEET